MRRVAALQGHPRRREAALQARAHLRDLLAEIARDVAHLRDPVPVIRQRAERPARGVAEIGPERGVGIDRHLVFAEFLVGDLVLDLRPVDVVVHLLGRARAASRGMAFSLRITSSQ